MLIISWDIHEGHMILGSLSKGVFELRTSTRSEIFFILKYIDNTKIVFLSLFLIIETICPNIWSKLQLKNELTWRRNNIYFFNIQIRVISTTFVTQQQPQYSNFNSHKFLNKCFTVYIDVPIFIELTNAHNFLRHTWGSHDIRELKQRCFWATHINQKWDLFHFKIYWQYQNCIS